MSEKMVKLAVHPKPTELRSHAFSYTYHNDCMSWQEFKDEPTADLVEYMRMVGPDDQVWADDAFRAFILRFREFVQKLCRKVAAGYGYDSYVGDQVAEDTFRKFRESGTFTPANCKSPNLDRCIKLYLSRTARRSMVDYHRKVTNLNPFDGSEELVYTLPNIDDLPVDPERLAILKAKNEVLDMVLARLSPKHRIIYLTYKQYELDLHREAEDGKPRTYYLPRHLLEKLRQETGLAQATIRKYKEEANAIIEPLLALYGNK